MVSSAPKDPMLVIIGATGTGKSKLAVELATKFNGEIINGDAMQMYKGLPIITNKIPDHERDGIPHHLLDFVGLNDEPWTVTHFVSEAQRIIRGIRSRGRLPILVGGTHYYTQSLLFKDSLLPQPASKDEIQVEQADKEWPILSASTEEMYSKLKELDPIIASRWHPKDRGHIRRCLEITLQTGRKVSDIYLEQEQRKQNHLGGGEEVPTGSQPPNYNPERMRYSSVIFWLHAKEEILKVRLNDRVLSMVASGLPEEASMMFDFCDEARSNGFSLDIGRGIWVSIGYKEILPYILALRQANSNEEDLSRIRDRCIEAIMAATRRYASRQVRWIRLTLMDFLSRAFSQDKLFLVDCSDLNRWVEQVSQPSERIAQAFLKGDFLPCPSSISSLAEEMFADSKRRLRKPTFSARKCNSCDKILMTDEEWQRHLRSSGHKKVIQSRQKRLENEKRRLAAAAARLERPDDPFLTHGELK